MQSKEFIIQVVPLSVFLSVGKNEPEVRGLVYRFAEQVLKLTVISHYTWISYGMSSLVLYGLLDINCSHALRFSKYALRKKYRRKFCKKSLSQKRLVKDTIQKTGNSF